VRGRFLLLLGLAASLVVVAVLAVQAISSHRSAVAPTSSVVFGRVLVDGHAMAGAQVTLYAWPNQAVVARLKIGDPVPLIVAGAGVSSSSGSYSISPTNWAALKRAATNGIVNFQVTATDGCRATSYFFPRKLVHTASGPALAVDNESKTPQLTAQHSDLRMSALTGRKCATGSG
jgi:hypothetical protein